MKLLILVLFQVVIFSSPKQRAYKSIKFSQLNWEMGIPTRDGFKYRIEVDTVQQISSSYIKESLMIDKGQFNTCTIKTKPSDSLVLSFNPTTYDLSKKVIVMSLKNQGSNIKFIDSVSSTEIISGVNFRVFHYRIKSSSPNKIINHYWYYSSFDKHDINIDVSYIDFKTGKDLLGIVRNSRIEKEK